MPLLLPVAQRWNYSFSAEPTPFRCAFSAIQSTEGNLRCCYSHSIISEGLYWSEQIFQKFQSMSTDTSTQLDIIHDNSVFMKMDQMILCPFQAENKNTLKCFQNVTFTLWQNPSGLFYSKDQCAKEVCLRSHIPALLGRALSSWIKTSDQGQPSVTLKLRLCNVQRYSELQNTRKPVQFFINSLEIEIYYSFRGSKRDDLIFNLPIF